MCGWVIGCVARVGGRSDSRGDKRQQMVNWEDCGGDDMRIGRGATMGRRRRAQERHEDRHGSDVGWTDSFGKITEGVGETSEQQDGSDRMRPAGEEVRGRE